jgi:probable phosphoglycerate mutase
MRVLLIRHGQTPSNVVGALDTAVPGPGLTELGHRQAAAVPSALESERVDAIAASVLVRTQLTATPLAEDRGLDIRIVPGLEEIEAGDLEMRRDRESQWAYISTVLGWADDLDRRMPGGPDGHEFFARYDRAVEHAVAGHSVVALFSHGAAIRAWVAGRVRGLDLDASLGHELDNTGMVVVEGSPRGGWDLVTWQEEPIGGLRLADVGAEDPTGEPV